MMLLDRSYYLQENVVRIARDLLGKVIVTGKGRERTSGIISETEAYAGQGDRASHAFGGRRTPRNEVMYKKGGVAYVYRCYGIHNLFNVVTNAEGVPHAILIRAVEPLEGGMIMRLRRGPSGKQFKSGTLSGGPGTLTTALAIDLAHNGADLISGTIRIEDAGLSVPDRSILVGPRVGVEYAKEDALLPYRFRVGKDHSFAP